MRNVGSEFGLIIPILSREDWEAVRPKRRGNTLFAPVHYVRLIATGSKTCMTNRDVVSEVQSLQERYMEHHNKPDIPWNFLIGPDGVVYKGRGWYEQPEKAVGLPELWGKHLDIALIGKFVEDDPPFRMMELAIEMIQYGIFMGILARTVKVFPFRDIPKLSRPKMRITLKSI